MLLSGAVAKRLQRAGRPLIVAIEVRWGLEGRLRGIIAKAIGPLVRITSIKRRVVVVGRFLHFQKSCYRLPGSWRPSGRTLAPGVTWRSLSNGLLEADLKGYKNHIIREALDKSILPHERRHDMNWAFPQGELQMLCQLILCSLLPISHKHKHRENNALC